MNIAIFGELNQFELVVLSSLMPAVFIYLWALITGDIKVSNLNQGYYQLKFYQCKFLYFQNFESSKTAYSVYTAKDPINCYQNYTEEKKDT